MSCFQKEGLETSSSLVISKGFNPTNTRHGSFIVVSLNLSQDIWSISNISLKNVFVYPVEWHCNICMILAHCVYNFLFSQAGMIRTEQEEFFIEPVETGHHVFEQEEEDGGRSHIVYRSAAMKKPPVSSLAADFHSKG